MPWYPWSMVADGDPSFDSFWFKLEVLLSNVQPMLSGRLLSGGRTQLHDFHRAWSVSKLSCRQFGVDSSAVLDTSQRCRLGISAVLTLSARRPCSSMAARKRPASEGSWTCSRRDCQQTISEEDARVEVAISLKGEVPPSDSMIKWQDGTPMAFHKSCWESLLQERGMAMHGV